MSFEKNQYIPPLVSGNKYKEYVNCHKTLEESNLPVAGYIRISTRKDSQQSSIENQKKYITEWANINHYHITKFYIDVKSGAYSYLRNEMQQLMEDIRTGKIRGMISKEISRTSRDIMDILEIKRNLADYGAFFISIKENYDSRTDDDEFLLIIHAGLAQKERKITSSRVKITQLIKAKEGKTNVASPAFGYCLSEDKQHLEIEPEKAGIYKVMVSKFLEGWGYLKICQWLNSQGFPAKRGGKWNTNSVKAILTNPVYLGITIYNATTLVRDSTGKQRRYVRPKEEWIIMPDTHEPLVSQEQYDRVQEMINKRQATKHKKWTSDKKYLLSGLIFCDACKCKIYGAAMRYTKRKNPKVYYKYVDQNRLGICGFKSWDMAKVDEMVMHEIKKFFSDRELIEERIQSKQYLYCRNMLDDNREYEIVMNQFQSIHKAVTKQQEAYENDIITAEEYKHRMGELRSLKNEASQKLEMLSKQFKKNSSMEERYCEVKDRVINLIENLEKLDDKTKVAIIGKVARAMYLREDYTVRMEHAFEE